VASTSAQALGGTPLNHTLHNFVNGDFGLVCTICNKTPEEAQAARPKILLTGGPWDLDQTEIDDTDGTVRVVKDIEGQDHLYYVMRDWGLNRWVGRYQNTRQVA
jgi:hypothetical protein